MSRRRGEFEHRTSIFEGAFRAWSHLGGLDPESLENQPATDLDPLSNPLDFDPRMESARKDDRYADSSRRLYPYEPLPRTGLAHPYVQAILSPWLGPDADHDAIQLGLTTLRTWWQHRRKGESGSAVAALGTEKMRGVVDGYTRHFFNLAHCLVVNDKEQPPRTLHSKLKELDKVRNKRSKKRAREEAAAAATSSNLTSSLPIMAAAAPPVAALQPVVSAAQPPSQPPPPPQQQAQQDPFAVQQDGMTPLERLHAAQRRQLLESGGLVLNNTNMAQMPLINMKGRCIPGKLDLPSVVNAVNHHATQLAHRGATANNANTTSSNNNATPNGDYGDPNRTPVVFVSENGDIQIAMSVDGITCAHCVKIVETVLRGCNGNKSPIDGLLDAAADRVLNRILIKIDESGNAKRIAFEAARNLSMVGYTAKAKEMRIVSAGADKKATMDLGRLSTAFEVVANTEPKDVFDWSISCTCPDNGIVRGDCARHSQMSTRIFEAFDTREKLVSDYMAGCGKKYGMRCTCGPDCRCKDCEEHCGKNQAPEAQGIMQQQVQQPQGNLDTQGNFYGGGMQPRESLMQPRESFGFGTRNSFRESLHFRGSLFQRQQPRESLTQNNRATRNPSIISLGTMRQMSLASDMTFGRTMSGLSALSIDWENMEDFDVNVDHSAHINNDHLKAPAEGQVPANTDGIMQNCAMMTGGQCNCGPNCLCDGCPIHDPAPSPKLPSSMRSTGDEGHGNNVQVAFKV